MPSKPKIEFTAIGQAQDLKELFGFDPIESLFVPISLLGRTFQLVLWENNTETGLGTIKLKETL